MQSYSENIWANAQRSWPNAHAFDEFRSHLVTFGRIDQMRAHLTKRARNLPNVAHLVKCRAFDQLVKCAARLPKAQIGQMSLTYTIPLNTVLLLYLPLLRFFELLHFFIYKVYRSDSSEHKILQWLKDRHYSSHFQHDPVNGVIVVCQSTSSVSSSCLKPVHIAPFLLIRARVRIGPVPGSGPGWSETGLTKYSAFPLLNT